MIRLRVDEAAAIPLAVESASPVSMTVKEEFIDRGGASIQSNKTATPGTAAVVVTPDPGYDAMAKVTVEAVPQGALSPIDINFDDSTGAFTAEARVGTSGYIPDTAFVGGGFQLSTQAAATITPTTVQQQAVAAHKYTTGAVVVDPIPSEYIIPSGTKNITSNGNAQDVKSYEKVNVSVPNSYAAADEGKVVSNGALVAQTSDTVTQNGTVDTTLIDELTVNVSGGGVMKVASGTFVATRTSSLDVFVGKKCPQTDFIFNFWIAGGTSITPQSSTDRIVTSLQYIAQKTFVEYDLSADGNISATSKLTYPVYVNGTPTNRTPDARAGNNCVVRQTTQASENNKPRYIKRDENGFKFSVYIDTQHFFESGATYNWELLYIGNDPTNDIVEVP